MQKNFEVLRLIKENMNCHIVADNVEGRILAEYIFYDEIVSKEQFWKWAILLARELECIEFVKNMSGYRYVTPFCIVVKSDGEIALLNLKDKKNQQRLDKLFGKEKIKEFLPQKNEYNDIFSYGKTLHFLVSKLHIDPWFTKREERKLKKIISKCLKNNSNKSYYNFDEVLSDISNIKQTNHRLRKILLTMLAIILCIFAFFKTVIFSRETSLTREEQEICFETGITYFNSMNAYEESEALFAQIRDSKKARYFQQMASYMHGTSNMSTYEIEMLMREFQNEMMNSLSYDEKFSLIKVYSKIGTSYGKKQVILLGEEILNSPEWQKYEEEIREYMDEAESSL